MPRPRCKAIHQLADSGSQSLVRARPAHRIAGLAQQLGLVTVAEGVEQLEICRWLSSVGIEQVQVFAIARPMPSSELLSWIDDRSPAARR